MIDKKINKLDSFKRLMENLQLQYYNSVPSDAANKAPRSWYTDANLNR